MLEDSENSFFNSEIPYKKGGEIQYNKDFNKQINKLNTIICDINMLVQSSITEFNIIFLFHFYKGLIMG
jgi:hypothetical protein